VEKTVDLVLGARDQQIDDALRNGRAPLLRHRCGQSVSARCQLIVTTHSTRLVDTMTDHADSVIVCDKPEATTVMTRLDPDEIAR
jgi:hypothetical protein